MTFPWGHRDSLGSSLSQASVFYNTFTVQAPLTSHVAFETNSGILENTLLLAFQLTFHMLPVSVSNNTHTQLLYVGYSSKRPGFLSSARGCALSTRFFFGFEGTMLWIVQSLVSSLRKTPVILMLFYLVYLEFAECTYILYFCL